MIKVKVPATSANLGMGFDCLGMALDIFTTVTVQPAAKLTITGCERQFRTPDNLVYQGFCEVCQYLKQSIPAIAIDIQSEIPPARGLGSSAACIVAGIRAGWKWFNVNFNPQVSLQLALHIENHPDNLAPAIYGGLCLAIVDNDKCEIITYPVHPTWHFLALIPSISVSTKQARDILPHQLRYADVTHQMSHCLAMLHALQYDNRDKLINSFADRMHEPYRKELIPYYDEIQSVATHHHAALYISGSGSTLIMISHSRTNRDKIKSVLQTRLPDWQCRAVQILT